MAFIVARCITELHVPYRDAFGDIGKAAVDTVIQSMARCRDSDQRVQRICDLRSNQPAHYHYQCTIVLVILSRPCQHEYMVS